MRGTNVTASAAVINVVAVAVNDTTAGEVRAKTAVKAWADWLVGRVSLSTGKMGVLLNVPGMAEVKGNRFAVWCRTVFERAMVVVVMRKEG
ncbi:hypothetical protein MaudCBS49596_000141 [Microsporum audouinii]